MIWLQIIVLSDFIAFEYINIYSISRFQTTRNDLCNLGLLLKFIQTIIVITYHNNIWTTTYLVCAYCIIRMCLFVVCIFLFVTDFCVCGTYELPTYVRIIYKTNDQTFHNMLNQYLGNICSMKAHKFDKIHRSYFNSFF